MNIWERLKKRKCIEKKEDEREDNEWLKKEYMLIWMGKVRKKE